MKKLQAQLKALEQFLPDFEKTNTLVSDVSIGWHIEHSLLVIKQITATVAQSEPHLYVKKFSAARFFVFLFGFFPRGKAKAPKVVMPVNKIDIDSLKESVAHTYQALNYLKDCQTNQYFMHPIFGQLNKAQTIRFLAIHTRHHLKIIKEIVAG